MLIIDCFTEEFAAVGARVTRVERLTTQGQRLAVALLPTLCNPLRLDRYIAACQLGITLSSLVLGAFGQATIGLALGAQLDKHTGLEPLTAYALSATITLVVLTSIQVVFGELIPKTVALQYPVGTAIYTYLPGRQGWISGCTQGDRILMWQAADVQRPLDLGKGGVYSSFLRRRQHRRINSQNWHKRGQRRMALT
ncbi:CNNM domain-containing protein [Sedimenticola hydrogenitrophicus]|uniref:CNNM domain-containing protein n=1 Tax=Sedimenticola hydrogenitrophicus TaxID=2967975 RepID=UPI0021A93127|nr:CNNM domain-containing protein [Sedimenticola hydrogenitrophicus]